MQRIAIYSLLILLFAGGTLARMASAGSSPVGGVSVHEAPDRETPSDPEPEDMIHPAEHDDPIAAAAQAKPEHFAFFTEADWRAILSDKEFYILRKSGTEHPGTGRYLNHGKDEKGAYHCAGCGLKLYSSEHKFHSGCGWPSFNQEVEEGALTYYRDESVGMVRTEMRCARCDGHLGHVFNDGFDQPTGLRHCVNGYAVVFVPEGADPAEVLMEHRRAQAEQ